MVEPVLIRHPTLRPDYFVTCPICFLVFRVVTSLIHAKVLAHRYYAKANVYNPLAPFRNIMFCLSARVLIDELLIWAYDTYLMRAELFVCDHFLAR